MAGTAERKSFCLSFCLQCEQKTNKKRVITSTGTIGSGSSKILQRRKNFRGTNKRSGIILCLHRRITEETGKREMGNNETTAAPVPADETPGPVCSEPMNSSALISAAVMSKTWRTGC